MAKISAASIRRAVSAASHRRPISVESWSNTAINLALSMGESEDERRLFRTIDSVCYGIRWAEMTGRVQTKSFRHHAWKDTRDIVERIVSLCLRLNRADADFIKDAWRELATLKDCRMAERADSLLLAA